jgi:DNA-binding response OmpR family regulator
MNKTIKTVLVADDDGAILESLQLLLQINDYQVITSTGENVIELIKEYTPNVVLLDIWMGMIDGKDLCKKIKADESISKTPIIMVSASNDIQKSFLETGATDFIEKPFDIDALIQKIEKCS